MEQIPRRYDLKSLLSFVEIICSEYNLFSLNRQLNACKKLFVDNPVIDIAILGQFKAGKSSFINSYIGKQVLPVGVIPVTTVITRLQYGRSERAVVSFFDGKKIEVGLDHIEEYISEAKNRANEKNVEMVDIEMPSLEPYQGLRFVDTPGLGSIFKYNTELSKEWLPEVGMAIVAISSDRPLSENDLNLIEELMGYTPNIILLLTKVDLLKREQIGEIIDFVKNSLKKEFEKDFVVLPYSTIIDSKVYIEHLDRIIKKLTGNREMELAGIVKHKVRSLARQCHGYLEIAFRTAAQTEKEREELKNLIIDEKVNYDLVRSEIILVVRDCKIKTRPFIASHLENNYRDELIKKLTEKLKKEMREWKGNLWRLTRRFEDWLTETMTQEMDHISRTEYKHFFGTLKMAHSSISRTVKLFRSLLDNNIQKVLGINLSSFDWVIEVSEPAHPDVAYMKTFDFHLDLIWFFFPMFIFRRVFERHFIKQIPRSVDIHLSRLAYQWEIRINKTIDEIGEQALRYIKDELSTIEAMISKSSGDKEEIRRKMDELYEGMEKIAL